MMTIIRRSREAVCHNRVLRQDSTSSAEQSVEMVEDVSDAALLPQFALRQDLDNRRPTARVQVLHYITLETIYIGLRKSNFKL